MCPPAGPSEGLDGVQNRLKFNDRIHHSRAPQLNDCSNDDDNGNDDGHQLTSAERRVLVVFIALLKTER